MTDDDEVVEPRDEPDGHVGSPPEHPPGWYCGASLRQSEGTCTNRAGFKTTHVGVGCCALHGGATPTHQVAAAAGLERQVEAQALAELTRLTADAPPVDNALEELAAGAGRVLAVVELLESRVASMGESWTATDWRGSESLRVEAAMWERLIAESRMWLTALAKLDIDSRLAKISESIGEAVVEVITSTLAELELSPPVIAQARAIARRRLVALDGGV